MTKEMEKFVIMIMLFLGIRNVIKLNENISKTAEEMFSLAEFVRVKEKQGKTKAASYGVWLYFH